MSNGDGAKKRGKNISDEYNNTAPRPLANLGNTCYLNSVLQPLARLACLRRYFVDSRAAPHGEGRLTREVRHYMRKQYRYSDSNSTTHAPRELLTEICARSRKFRGYRQQDAHEVLRVILEGVVEEERARVGAPKNGPPVTALEKLLTGTLVASIICDQCQVPSRSSEPFLDIPLPLVKKPKSASKTDITPNTHTNTHIQAQDNNTNTESSPPCPRAPPTAPPPPPRRGLKGALFGSRRGSSAGAPPAPKPTARAARTSEIRTDTSTRLEADGLGGVEDSLGEFMKPIVFEGANAYVCDTCTKRARKKAQRDRNDIVAKTRAIRSVAVQSAPQVLVLFLVRFAHGRSGGLVKRSGHVPFPDILSLDPYNYTANGENTNNKNNNSNNTYQLKGLSRHGGSLHSGHYTSYVRNGDGQWYHCNDEVISACDAAKVHKAEAYVLFYELIDD